MNVSRPLQSGGNQDLLNGELPVSNCPWYMVPSRRDGLGGVAHATLRLQNESRVFMRRLSREMVGPLDVCHRVDVEEQPHEALAETRRGWKLRCRFCLFLSLRACAKNWPSQSPRSRPASILAEQRYTNCGITAGALLSVRAGYMYVLGSARYPVPPIPVRCLE